MLKAQSYPVDHQIQCVREVLTESDKSINQDQNNDNIMENGQEFTCQKGEKHYKKFDFFYRRTAFRCMTEFYKSFFKPNLDKWREGERKSTKNFVLSYLCKQSEMELKEKEQEV